MPSVRRGVDGHVVVVERVENMHRHRCGEERRGRDLVRLPCKDLLEGDASRRVRVDKPLPVSSDRVVMSE